MEFDREAIAMPGTEYRILEVRTRFAGVRYDVQVIIGGRHAHWHECSSLAAAEAWVVAQVRS